MVSPCFRMPCWLVMVTSCVQRIAFGVPLLSEPIPMIGPEAHRSSAHLLSICCVQSRLPGGVCIEMQVAPLLCPLELAGYALFFYPKCLEATLGLIKLIKSGHNLLILIRDCRRLEGALGVRLLRPAGSLAFGVQLERLGRHPPGSCPHRPGRPSPHRTGWEACLQDLA